MPTGASSRSADAEDTRGRIGTFAAGPERDIHLKEDDVTSTRTVAQKMGIKPGWTAHLVNAPDRAASALGLPELEMIEHLTGELDTSTCS